MDNVVYAVTVDLDEGEDTTYDLGANFPNELITETSHTLQLTLHDSGVVYDISSLSASTVKIKKNDSTASATTLATGTLTTDGTDGRIDFVINKDLIPASLAAFPQSPDRPVVLYYITIEDANSKIQVRKLITVYDIDGTGTSSANPEAADFVYEPTTPGDWTTWTDSGTAPSLVGTALDDCADGINTLFSDKLDLAGGTMTGSIDMGGQVLSDPVDPTAGTEVGDRDYNDARYGQLSGATFTGELDLSAAGAKFGGTASANLLDNVDHQSFTPTFNNFTIGNGSVYGEYQVINKVCHFDCAFTMGSTSAVTGALSLSALPEVASGATTDSKFPINAVFYDYGTNVTNGYSSINTGASTSVSIKTNSGDAVANATVPHTWAVNDTLTITGQFPIT